MIHYTETQIIAALPGLSQSRLLAYMQAEVVVPLQTDSGPLFRPVDLARLALLCDLTEDFALEGDALGIVMQLLDQLHDARHHLHLILEAIASEPPEVRNRIGTRLAGGLAAG